MVSVVQQRPLRGSRISTFYPVKNLPSLASLDSAFQLQEYISLLIRLDVHDVDTIVSVPGKGNGKEKAKDGGPESDADKERRGEVAVDEACWIYEQLRRLAQDLSHPLITMLQQECNRASCPEMKAGEWLYLCVAHGDDGAREQCCAIDYILHTLDSATALLNSPRAFPSRLSIPQTSHRHFSSLARRLGRIFAHAYFHHREAFEQAEAESSLYARFLALTSKFDLVPPEFLVIPSRITLLDGRGDRRDMDVQPPRLHAAAIDPQGERDQDRQREQRERDTIAQDWQQRVADIGLSPPGLGHEPGRESPRKFGRNRTDTMVFSEAVNVAEELAKSGGGEEKSEEQDMNEVETDSPPYPSVSGLTYSPPPPLPSASAFEETVDSHATFDMPSEAHSAVTVHDTEPENVNVPHETPLQEPPIPAEPLSLAAADDAGPEEDKPHSDATEHEPTSVPLPEAEPHEPSEGAENTEEGTQLKEQEVAGTEAKDEEEPLITPVPQGSSPSPEPEEQGSVDATPVITQAVETVAPPLHIPAIVAETPCTDAPKTDVTSEEHEGPDFQPVEPPPIDEGVVTDTVSNDDSESGLAANAEAA